MIELVVADLAGTTVDFGSRAPAGAFVELFRKFGIEVSEQNAREPMGMHKRDHISTMFKNADVSSAWKAMHRVDYTEVDIDEMFEAFIPMQLACLPDFCDLIPGWADTSKQLQLGGVKLAATTGYNREMTDIVLTAAADQGYVPDSNICSVEVTKGRPAPWMIYESMHRNGVFSINSVLKVGDTISDIEAGINAGCYTVGVVKTGNMLGMSQQQLDEMDSATIDSLLNKARRKMIDAGADAVINSVTELPELIKAINKQ